MISQAEIDADNIASQKLFQKIGSRLSGITEYFFYEGAERREFEADNKELISNHMIELAGILEEEPSALLSHALSYRLKVDRM